MESGCRAVDRSAEGLRALVKGTAAATAEMPMARYLSTRTSREGFVSAFGEAVAVFIIVSIRRGRVAWAGPDVRMRMEGRCGGGGLRSWSDRGGAGIDSRRAANGNDAARHGRNATASCLSERYCDGDR